MSPLTELPPVIPNNLKRKREADVKERGGDDEDRDKERKEISNKGSYTVKYIGESNRSGYERGREHIEQFRNMRDQSHLLKHYLQCHKDMDIEEMEVGMRVRSTFKSAIERQISEAVAISRAESEGTILMNSKAEYNRCKLPRLNTQTLEDQIKEADTEKEKKLSKEISELRKKKKVRKKENNEENLEKNELLEVCNDILKENSQRWKRRRMEEVKWKEEIEKEEERIERREGEKKKRIEKANRKRTDLKKKLEKEGRIPKESKKRSWKELKHRMWRNIREKEREEGFETESEEEIDILDEADQILEILEELEAERKKRR